MRPCEDMMVLYALNEAKEAYGEAKKGNCSFAPRHNIAFGAS